MRRFATQLDFPVITCFLDVIVDGRIISSVSLPVDRNQTSMQPTEYNLFHVLHALNVFCLLYGIDLRENIFRFWRFDRFQCVNSRVQDKIFECKGYVP